MEMGCQLHVPAALFPYQFSRGGFSRPYSLSGRVEVQQNELFVLEFEVTLLIHINTQNDEKK